MERTQIVLVVEDQPLIALEVEQMVREAGLSQVFTVPSADEAFAWLEQRTPLVAVLEARVHDGDCNEIAALLSHRDVPFIVHTVQASPDSDDGSPLASCRAWIEKPGAPDIFIAAVKACLLSGARGARGARQV